MGNTKSNNSIKVINYLNLKLTLQELSNHLVSRGRERSQNTQIYVEHFLMLH